MRKLSTIEVESIIARVLRNSEIYVYGWLDDGRPCIANFIVSAKEAPEGTKL